MASIFGDKYCFVHIPKCGGKWVRKVLQDESLDYTKDVSDGHAPAPDDLPEGLVSFCFIRHPASWLASWWAHCERHGWANEGPMPEDFDLVKPYHWMQTITARHRGERFEEFVHNLEGARPGFVAKFFKPFIDSVDLVGQQETLREDLGTITGRTFSQPPFNVGLNRPTPSPEIVRYVASQEPIEALGYGGELHPKAVSRRRRSLDTLTVESV